MQSCRSGSCGYCQSSLIPIMATAALLYSPKFFSSQGPIQASRSFPSRATPTTAARFPPLSKLNTSRELSILPILGSHGAISVLVGAGFWLTLGGSASASEFPLWGSLQLSEPDNALSLPTWAIHVSSVIEWITAMILVWQYGDKSGYESWKGLSWGMVPLLGGAFCACTWHFFYNSESLEVLVALQAALTVIGNFTMCIAAFRIYKSSQERT